VKLSLCVDGAEFMERLATELPRARRSVGVQALSFEGDAAGEALAGMLLSCPAPDRLLLVDAFTRHILSDRFLWTPAALRDSALRAERRRTRGLLRALAAEGVRVRITNPAGFLLRRLPFRNHKKLVVVDREVAYLGGINFSDHNLAWHDLMLRIEDPGAAAFLADDLEATWSGRDRSESARFGGLELHLLDGRRSPRGFAAIFAELAAAEGEIFVHSPYLSSPFLERLGEARRRGVRVVVATPLNNNHARIRDQLLWEAARLGLEVRLYPGRMSHLKAMRVDDRALLLGSANFDWLSFGFCQEVVAVVRDVELIDEFVERVERPDLAISPIFEGEPPARGRRAARQLRGAARALSVLGPR
jgi:cardiolipin synthase A/B